MLNTALARMARSMATTTVASKISSDMLNKVLHRDARMRDEDLCLWLRGCGEPPTLGELTEVEELRQAYFGPAK
jgi:hypothetical protein